MVNPTLSKIADKALTANNNTKRLFQIVFRDQNKNEAKDDDSPKIKVSELISKMAFYYEKIRNTVDYKEEHLLRKNAIERILKRLIVIEGSITVKNSRNIALHLLTELIRAAYLPNNSIKEEMIDVIAATLEKYLKLRRDAHMVLKDVSIKERGEMVNWILAIAACDIEEQLGRSKADLAVIDYMYEILTKHIEFPDGMENEKNRNIQIYLAIYRKYLKFDKDMLTYILFKYYNADWLNPKDEDIAKIGEKILLLKAAIERQLEHPMAHQISVIAGRYTVFFTVLLDVIRENPVGIYEDFKRDPKAFPRQIKNKAAKRYAEARSKLWRAGVRSIIYIFITKSLFAIMLEVPATRWFGEVINNVSLTINICFPAVLLFLIILFTQLPSDKNSLKIVEGVNEIVFEGKERKEPFKLRRQKKRGAALNTVFGIIYSITFFLSFGAVIWTLVQINFTFVSITIFLFFLAFVSFFSIRIRRLAKEYVVLEPSDNLLSLFVDFFYIPIVRAGKWLSEKFSRINVFVFILDFIIEAPFKVFVEIAEEWTRYVKERKEDIV